MAAGLEEPPAQLPNKSDLDCALDHYFAFPEYRKNDATREDIQCEVWSRGGHITVAKSQFDECLKTGKLVKAGTDSCGDALYRRP